MKVTRVQLPLSVDPEKQESLQNQIVEGIRTLIVEGKILPQTRLPASRALSTHLGVSRNTVKIAYQNLISQGYLVGRGTLGTFVSTTLPDSLILATREKGQVDHPAHLDSASSKDRRVPFPIPPGTPGAINLDIRAIDPSLAPERTWRRLFIEHLPQKTRNLTMTDPAGLGALRESICNTICPLRGMTVDASDIMVVSNEYRALDIIIRTILKPGDPVAVEDPCDAGLIFLLASHGAAIIPIPVEQDGMVVSHLWQHTPKAVFVSPPHQRPTAATLRPDRRDALLAWAQEEGGYIVERDAFGEFNYTETPHPALCSLDASGRIIYVNSFSSWMGDSLQMAYVIAPSGLVARLLDKKRYLCPNPDWITQRVTAEFISSERFFGHLRRVRLQLKTRRDAMIDALNSLVEAPRITGHPAGSHFMWHLPDGAPDARDVQSAVREMGVDVPTLHDGYHQAHSHRPVFDQDRILLMGFAGLSEELARIGVARLVRAIQPG